MHTSSVLALTLLASSAAFAADAEGCADHPLVTRMPGYVIGTCDAVEFGEATFAVKNQPEVVVAGKKWVLRYVLPEGGKGVSDVFLARNYTSALTNVGAVVKGAQPNGVGPSLMLKKGGAELWVSVSGYTGDGTPEALGSYYVTIVEKGQMQQVVKATDILDELTRTGRAVLYVQFDSGKDVIKPESLPLVEQMAVLLKKERALAVYVVGHTDTQGALESNLKLSESRAAAVVKVLTAQHGVEGKRLVARGVGPLSPLASNDTEAGRKLNRRVELVKQ
jgi:OmpA-OmpF porin, OOP family